MQSGWKSAPGFILNMRVIIKSIDNLKKLLKDITSKNRKSLNDWFYNATDEDLKQAINLLNSSDFTALYPRQCLKEYIKFARSLLHGNLPSAPTDLDIWSDSNINYYKFAQGSYELFFSLESIVQQKQKTLFKKCSLLAVAQKSLYACRSQLFLTRHLASFCRIVNSRLLIALKLSLNALKDVNKTSNQVFKSKAQNNKLKLKVIREMIKKGRVNLEQRAFWTWVIIYDEVRTKRLTSLQEDFSLLKLVAHSANLRYFHCLKSKFEKWKQSRPELAIYSLLSTSPDTPFRSTSKSVLQYAFKKKFKRSLAGLMSCVYSRLDFSFDQVKKYAEYRSLNLYKQSQLVFIKPFIQNLVHVHQKRLVEVFEKWKEGYYEYAYEETVVTVSNQKKNFQVVIKPIVILDFQENFKPNKILARNLSHILHRKMFAYWNRWVKYRKFDPNFSTEVSLDLAMFKLPFARFEKLRMTVVQLLSIAEQRKNLPMLVISHWMQASCKRTLTKQKIKLIFQTQQTNRDTKKHAFTAFQLCSQFQTEFTDIV